MCFGGALSFVQCFHSLYFIHGEKRDGFSLRFIESPEEPTVDQESEDDLNASRTSLERQAPHRGNTTVHVCWHRNTSVSMVDFSIAVEVSASEQAGLQPQRDFSDNFLSASSLEAVIRLCPSMVLGSQH